MALSQRRTELLHNLGRLAVAATRPHVKSATLRKTLAYRLTTRGITIGVPYYWAKFYHDGRRGFGPKTKQFLVFFKDPDEDPRNRGGYPKLKRDRKRLTKRQFEKARDADQLIITDRVGPARGNPFLLKGLRDLRKLATPMLRRFIIGDLQQFIRRGQDRISIRL